LLEINNHKHFISAKLDTKLENEIYDILDYLGFDVPVILLQIQLFLKGSTEVSENDIIKVYRVRTILVEVEPI
jgi:hypothetical protein